MKTQATRFLFLVVLTQLLYGCTFLTDLINPNRTVVERIDDVKIIMTAAYGSIGMDVESGLLDVDVAQKRLDEVRKLRIKLGDVTELLKLGDLEIAELKLKIIETSVVNIREYIHTQATKVE